ncbi:MAG: potassium-transporting ATPase subunit C [Thaumarchaeota archaeon]|nr:potassium-transporting ATPase subunit C [Nitrososphaerota archaeon]
MENSKPNYRPVVGLAVLSLVICGLLFPLAITGIAQVILPFQANGEIVQLNGHSVGSSLIAQGFNSPKLFHARASNQSASGVDPDIPLSDALLQVPRISSATNIPSTTITSIVNGNVEGTIWIFGSPYVNVLKLNLILIEANPTVYQNLTF